MLLLLFILVLLGTGLGAFYLLTSSGGATSANQVVGHAYFISTGQVRADSTQGLDDMVRITLSNIPPPASVLWESAVPVFHVWMPRLQFLCV